MTPEEYIKAYTRGNSNELVHGDYHEWLTPENALAAVELAREEMREQMMKDAVDGEVNIWCSHISLPKVLPSEFSKQRVKVIIIKE